MQTYTWRRGRLTIPADDKTGRGETVFRAGAPIALADLTVAYGVEDGTKAWERYIARGHIAPAAAPERAGGEEE